MTPFVFAASFAISVTRYDALKDLLAYLLGLLPDVGFKPLEILIDNVRRVEDAHTTSIRLLTFVLIAPTRILLFLCFFLLLILKVCLVVWSFLRVGGLV